MKIKKLAIFSILITFVSLTVSCSLEVAPGAKEVTIDSGSAGASDKVIIIENVVRIFMHQPNEFTYCYLKPGTTNQIVMFTLTSYNQTFFLDAEKGKLWVKYWGSTGAEKHSQFQEIHLSTIDDINGAGWIRSQGKSTIKGSTTILE